MQEDAILWERIDAPGHDACRLARCGSGWDVSGTAVFAHNAKPACLRYQVTCDRDWRTIDGSIFGWCGSQAVAAHFRHTPEGSWTMNERAIDLLADCVDLDFSFTPATNIFQIRRLALAVGERAVVPVAWFDLEADGLQRLSQTYQRVSDDTYAYAAPSVPYAAELEVNPSGFVRTYPGLWQQCA